MIAERQTRTHTHTDTLITILRCPIGGGVTTSPVQDGDVDVQDALVLDASVGVRATSSASAVIRRPAAVVSINLTMYLPGPDLAGAPSNKSWA